MMSWMYLGAVMVSSCGLVFTNGIDPELFKMQPLLSWLYLGIISSGVAFWLWNKGAVSVPVGKLAVANNLKVPMGIAIAALVFQESVVWSRLIIGAVLISMGFLMVRKQSNIS